MKPVAPAESAGITTLSASISLQSTNKDNWLDLLKGLLGHPTEEVSTDEDEFEPPSSVRTALAVSSVMLDWPALSEAEASSHCRGSCSSGRSAEHILAEKISSLNEPNDTRRFENDIFDERRSRLAKEHGYTDVRFSSVVIFHEMLKPTVDDLVVDPSVAQNRIFRDGTPICA